MSKLTTVKIAQHFLSTGQHFDPSEGIECQHPRLFVVRFVLKSDTDVDSFNPQTPYFIDF